MEHSTATLTLQQLALRQALPHGCVAKTLPPCQRRERLGKSPAELLTGQRHRHWLELLGYQRFSRN